MDQSKVWRVLVMARVHLPLALCREEGGRSKRINKRKREGKEEKESRGVLSSAAHTHTHTHTQKACAPPESLVSFKRKKKDMALAAIAIRSLIEARSAAGEKAIPRGLYYIHSFSFFLSLSLSLSLALFETRTYTSIPLFTMPTPLSPVPIEQCIWWTQCIGCDWQSAREPATTLAEPTCPPLSAFRLHLALGS